MGRWSAALTEPAEYLSETICSLEPHDDAGVTGTSSGYSIIKACRRRAERRCQPIKLPRCHGHLRQDSVRSQFRPATHSYGTCYPSAEPIDVAAVTSPANVVELLTDRRRSQEFNVPWLGLEPIQKARAVHPPNINIPHDDGPQNVSDRIGTLAPDFPNRGDYRGAMSAKGLVGVRMPAERDGDAFQEPAPIECANFNLFVLRTEKDRQSRATFSALP